MNPHIGLSDDQRCGIAGVLTPLLADEYMLYTKARNYHWNVVGLQFNDLHKFFEEQYNALNIIVDDVAERLRTVGSPALGTLAEFLEHTRLTEHPEQYPPAAQMIENLLRDQEYVIRQLRHDIDTCEDVYHDVGTADFLTNLLKLHENMSWMLRSFLVDVPVASSA